MKLKQLTNLEVYNCGLESLKGDLLTDCRKPEKVSFENNDLTVIGHELFYELPRLRKVNLLGRL
jgi:hypothetical protein